MLILVFRKGKFAKSKLQRNHVYSWELSLISTIATTKFPQLFKARKSVAKYLMCILRHVWVYEPWGHVKSRRIKVEKPKYTYMTE